MILDVSRARAEMAAAVGEPTPGGSWKRGESRPTRYVDTQLFIVELRRRGLVAAYEDAGDDAVERRMVEVIRTLAGPTKATSPLDGVDLEREPRGGIRITVPLGTKVTIVQRDADQDEEGARGGPAPSTDCSQALSQSRGNAPCSPVSCCSPRRLTIATAAASTVLVGVVAGR